MPAASSSRTTKRARASASRGGEFEYGLDTPDDLEPTSEASASHLVSFLTGYDNRAAYNANGEDDPDGAGSSDEDPDPLAGGVDEDDDYDEDEEEEDEGVSTPTKRSRTGLVGTPGTRTPGSAGTPTPRKRRTGTTTPRRKKSALQLQHDQANDSGLGFIRPSRSDAYFLLASRPARTSGNSYSSLVRPLSQAEYEQHSNSARAQSSSAPSRRVVDRLVAGSEERWDQWEAEMDQGFNLIFYGFGSKRRPLNRFVQKRLGAKGHCVVVNGHFPGMGIREVLSQIEDALSVPQDIPVPASCTTPLDRAAHRVYAYFVPPEAIPTSKGRSAASSSSSSIHSTSPAPLYLVIHNIDSPSLRTRRSLSVLSLLASSPRIHLLASFDHLHTPLLFSTSQSCCPPHTYTAGSWIGSVQPSRGFNWLYHNLTTYDDYDLELSYQRLSATSTTLSGLSSSSGISEEGALQILRSVPPMALRLLKLLLTKQLASLPPNPSAHIAHPANQVAPAFAIDNDILQALAREKFIAREEERYNALMGEFKDHGLVVEAGLDGESRTGRWIWVPLGKAAVERVVEAMGEVQV
ncbi:hypothetical protein JCM24511_09602 [Saitozyma sp. JCM 24511]|nr:hypothetical protein JCM24511_09602 [Saitozyma sp. JCM 24511]